MEYVDICKITKFAVKKYKINYPKHLSINDFCHEVAVFIFLRCHTAEPLRAAGVIKNVRWAAVDLFKKANKKQFVSPVSDYTDNVDSCDNKDEIEELLDASGEDREFLQQLLDNESWADAARDMKLTRQEFHNEKKKTFERIRYYTLVRE